MPSFLDTPSTTPPAAAAPPAPVVEKRASPFAFFIDTDGYARRGDGGRCQPQDIGSAVLYDQRGEGEFATIIWADDSRGIPSGLQLDIAPAF